MIDDEVTLANGARSRRSKRKPVAQDEIGGFVSVKRAAEIAGVGYHWAYERVTDGRFADAEKVDGRWRVPTHEVLAQIYVIDRANADEKQRIAELEERRALYKCATVEEALKLGVEIEETFHIRISDKKRKRLAATPGA